MTKLNKQLKQEKEALETTLAELVKFKALIYK